MQFFTPSPFISCFEFPYCQTIASTLVQFRAKKDVGRGNCGQFGASINARLIELHSALKKCACKRHMQLASIWILDMSLRLLVSIILAISALLAENFEV
jgi:hypothetical protein